jgi:hypothetical protein
VNLTAENVGAEKSGAIASHNNSEAAHPYILGLISGLSDKFMSKSDISIKKAQLTLEDGSSILIDVVVASDGTTISKYTNLVPTSIDTDGSIYGGIGYKAGYRLSSSGAAKEHQSGFPYVTGYMPAKAGDVVRIAGIQWYVADSAINYICAYDSEFNFIGGITASGMKYADFQTDAPTLNCAAELTTCTLPSGLTDIAYIRVNWVGTQDTVYDPTLAVVTVNQEIT